MDKSITSPLLVHVSLHYRPIRGGQQVYIENLNRVLNAAGWRTVVIQPNRGETGADTLTVPRIPKIAWLCSAFDEVQFAPVVPVFQRKILDQANVILCHYASTAHFLCKFENWRRKTIVLSHGIEWNVDRMGFYDRCREQNAKALFPHTVTIANDTDYLRRMGLSIEPATRYYEQLSSRSWFIPNCVDTSHFRPAPRCPQRNDKPLILVPRQICEDRGIHLAIEAFSQFVRIAPGSKMHIIGPKPNKAYFARCVEMVARYNLKEQIKFLPPVSNREMVPFYRSADLTLIPTLRREGTSLSALESMACGTPVVLTNVAGLKDIPGVHSAADAYHITKALLQVSATIGEESIRQLTAIQSTFTQELWSDAWKKILEAVAFSQ